jgi:hypothetical protein
LTSGGSGLPARLGFDESDPDRVSSKLGTVVQAQFRTEVLAMAVDSARADNEHVGNIFG